MQKRVAEMPDPANTEGVIHAFSEDHVLRLTGLSKGQLRAWDKSGIFVPFYAYENRRVAYSRVYSFRDVVGLRMISVLLKEYRVPLRELRRVVGELIRRGYNHWADMKLYVVKRQVHFQMPNTEQIEGVWDGQFGMLPIIDVINDISVRVSDLRKRTGNQFGNVEQHKYVARNAWVVAGTRIPTAAIRRFREAGYSVDQILREYPTLTRKDVKAALSHEAGLARRA